MTTSNETETVEEPREEAASAPGDGTPAEPAGDATEATGDATEDAADVEEGVGSDDAQDASKANREAARYRRQLRDAETERDTLAERVATLERASVEAIASRHVERPAALWALGYKAADLITDDGSVDSLKVREVCDEAKSTFGLARSTQGNYVPNEGTKPTNRYKPDDFADSFGPKD